MVGLEPQTFEHDPNATYTSDQLDHLLIGEGDSQVEVLVNSFHEACSHHDSPVAEGRRPPCCEDAFNLIINNKKRHDPPPRMVPAGGNIYDARPEGPDGLQLEPRYSAPAVPLDLLWEILPAHTLAAPVPRVSEHALTCTKGKWGRVYTVHSTR